ncbi:MAG: flagellar biosynthesis protein FlhB [Alicyclobacillus sp.]|nr:flagellar biosynthesis protein FlhB [Alicyclobacillus sp.]
MLPFVLQRFADEKTERATPHRRRKARQEGRVPRSTDLTSALALLAAVAALHAWGGTVWANSLDWLRNSLSGQGPADWTVPAVTALLRHGMVQIAQAVSPILAAAAVVGGLAAMVQAGGVFVPRLALPDLQRINPLAGWKRLFSGRSLIETAKACLRLAVLAWLAYATTRGQVAQLELLSGMDPAVMAVDLGGRLYHLALMGAALLVLIAAGDYAYQRFAYERSLRMTRRELRDELREQEGDPQLKARIRQRGRALALRRMMQNVPQADVVVTNPTHYAVALRYDAPVMSAPQVVAKGQDQMAWRIRQLAQAHGVPTVENKPLAQALYRQVELLAYVPPDLYQAVAEVLAYVYRLQGRPAGRR